jgi:hypothetical protein
MQEGMMTVPPPEQFRSQNELVAYLSALENRVAELEGVNQQQQLTIDELRHQRRSEPRTGQLDTDLLHPRFIKRAFAVWGHNFVASLIVGLILALILFVIFLIIYFSSGGIYPFL